MSLKIFQRGRDISQYPSSRAATGLRNEVLTSEPRALGTVMDLTHTRQERTGALCSSEGESQGVGCSISA